MKKKNSSDLLGQIINHVTPEHKEKYYKIIIELKETGPVVTAEQRPLFDRAESYGYVF